MTEDDQKSCISLHCDDLMIATLQSCKTLLSCNFDLFLFSSGQTLCFNTLVLSVKHMHMHFLKLANVSYPYPLINNTTCHYSTLSTTKSTFLKTIKINTRAENSCLMDNTIMPIVLILHLEKEINQYITWC